jgi:uncharacterized protein YndB with AHSA1/START domain
VSETPDAVRDVSEAPDRLTLEATIPSRTPAETLRWWTEPTALARWWPPQAEVGLRRGGAYRFQWPKQGWTLRGVYETVEAPSDLAFTWRWDHEPERRTIVRVILRAAVPDGTVVRVEHGTYGSSPADRDLKESPRAGWLHFLARLRAEASGSPTKSA